VKTTPNLSDWVEPAGLEAASFVSQSEVLTERSGARFSQSEVLTERSGARFSQSEVLTERKGSVDAPTETKAFTEDVKIPDSEFASGKSGGLDPSLLLNLLGSQMADQNPSLAPLLGLLNGEKPDILSLLPLLLPLLTAKKTREPEPPNKTKINPIINLDEYSAN